MPCSALTEVPVAEGKGGSDQEAMLRAAGLLGLVLQLCRPSWAGDVNILKDGEAVEAEAGFTTEVEKLHKHLNKRYYGRSDKDKRWKRRLQCAACQRVATDLGDALGEKHAPVDLALRSSLSLTHTHTHTYTHTPHHTHTRNPPQPTCTLGPRPNPQRPTLSRSVLCDVGKAA